MIVPPDGGPAVFFCVGFGFLGGWRGCDGGVVAEGAPQPLENHQNQKKSRRYLRINSEEFNKRSIK